MKLKLTIFARIFIYVVCQFDSIVFAIQRLVGASFNVLLYPSVPAVTTRRAFPAAVPTGGQRCIIWRGAN